MGIRKKKSLLEQAGETVAAVAGTVVDTVSTTVGDVTDFVETKVGDVVEAAKEAVAEEEPAPGRKGGKLKKVLLLGVVVAVGGAVFKKLKGSGNSQSKNWQADYVPKPAPAAPAAAPAAPAAAKPAPVEAETETETDEAKPAEEN